MNMIEFINQMINNPMLLVSSILILGVILVNGWTDAPNAIATCVSTRAISVRKAIIMAAIFNFLGVLIMTSVNASVAFTIYNMVFNTILPHFINRVNDLEEKTFG